MCLNPRLCTLRLEIWLHNNRSGYQAAEYQAPLASTKKVKFTRPSQRLFVGDLLSYDDGDDRIETVRIRDYGTSAVKGHYYIVTSILDPDSQDDSCDVWVSDEKMQVWLECRVNVEDETDEC